MFCDCYHLRDLDARTALRHCPRSHLAAVLVSSNFGRNHSIGLTLKRHDLILGNLSPSVVADSRSSTDHDRTVALADVGRRPRPCRPDRSGPPRLDRAAIRSGVADISRARAHCRGSRGQRRRDSLTGKETGAEPVRRSPDQSKPCHKDRSHECDPPGIRCCRVMPYPYISRAIRLIPECLAQAWPLRTN